MEIFDEHQNLGKSDSDEKYRNVEKQEEEKSQIIEFIQLVKKLENLTQSFKKEIQNVVFSSASNQMNLFQKEINLVKHEGLKLIKYLNQHLESILCNKHEINRAIDKIKNTESSLSNAVRVPLDQQEYLFEYLKECERNIKNLRENLNVYEKFNVSLYLNDINLNNIKSNESQFDQFYQNLQNEIDYFLKFYQKFVNESKIIC